MQALHLKLRHIVLAIAAFGVLATPALAHPGSAILVDRNGQIYFIDTGSGLWKIDSRGALSHLSPLKNHWLAMDPNDRFTQDRVPTDSGRDWVITAVGSNPTMLISTDFPLVIGQDGNLYYPSVRENNARLFRSSSTGGTSTFVTLPRSLTGSPVPWINGITTGPDNSIFYTEDTAIRRVTSAGRVTTAATVAPLAHGPAIPGNSKHPYLRGLKVDANGVMYVADAGDARVLKIAPDGKTTTLVQLESPWAPTDVAVFGDTVYSLEFSHDAGDERTTWMPRVRKISPDGKSTIIVTIDQMPGARATKSGGSVSYNLSSAELWCMLLRSLFLFT